MCLQKVVKLFYISVNDKVVTCGLVCILSLVYVYDQLACTYVFSSFAGDLESPLDCIMPDRTIATYIIQKYVYSGGQGGQGYE